MRQEDGLIPLLTSTGQRLAAGGREPYGDIYSRLIFRCQGPALLRRGHSHEYSDSREIKAHINLGSTDWPARHTLGVHGQ